MPIHDNGQSKTDKSLGRAMSLSKELLTGIQEIDDQHGSLFLLLGNLQSQIGSGQNWSDIYFTLSELSHYARTHFTIEESVMRLHGYPDLEQHIAEHRSFIEKLSELEAKAVRKDVGPSIVEFIRQWLENHIGKSDQAYVQCLRTRPVI
jgi:hemerythrin